MNKKVEPVFYSAHQLADLLGVSYRQVWRMLSKGLLVGVVRLSGSVKFRKADIDKWIQLGCPDRQVFEQQKSA
jgi:excisionase family DNA binding protein